MSQVRPSDGRLQAVEMLLTHFAQAWQQKDPPPIEQFLPRAFDDDSRRNLLIELIKIDLENRWRRAGQGPPSPPGANGTLPDRPLLEHYLGQFAELGPVERFPVALIAEEYNARRRWGDRPLVAAYLAGFPAQAAELSKLLVEPEGELAPPPLAPPSHVVAPSPPIASVPAFLELLRDHQLLKMPQLNEVIREDLQGRFPDARRLGAFLLEKDWLTPYQVNQILKGNIEALTLGHYLLLERLGGGVTGQVFKARHRTMNRVAAVKVIRPTLIARPEVVQRFEQEMQAISQLSHAHVVHAYDAGPVALAKHLREDSGNGLNETYFLAMEFVEGTNLGQMVKESGPLPVVQACDYVRQAALGLQHIHQHGLVHRDLKPSNLVVTRTSGSKSRSQSDSDFGFFALEFGVVKILDLGLALWQHSSDEERTILLTKQESVLGTPDFMAPEQADDARTVDIRADLYSLGCTFFYLLTGQVPFPGGSFIEKVVRHRSAVPPRVEDLRRDVPAEFCAVAARLLAKSPADRYQVPAELADALARATGASSSSLAPPTVAIDEAATTIDEVQLPPELTGPPEVPEAVEHPWPAPDLPPASSLRLTRTPAERRRWPLVAGFGTLTCVLAVVGYLLLQRYMSPPEARPGDPPRFTNSLGEEFALIPAGSFQMGSPESEKGRRADEGPRHLVTLTKPFYMGVHEVTVRDFRAFVDETKYQTQAERTGKGAFRYDADKKEWVRDAKCIWKAPGYPIADDLPVTCVTWTDAAAFCEWLSKKEGRRYRLPTEAEWEYACRADTTTPFHFGTSPSIEQANVLSEADATAEKVHGLPVGVGSYRPNLWGLSDMHGNAAEWCADYYDPGAYRASFDKDPQGPSFGSKRVIRGGSCLEGSTGHRCASRHALPPNDANNVTGFRMVTPVRTP
ncbi:MAG: SUMF1/EgtB/PvdO family nonheme iron enzyme [Gemmataceae bacterium]|nr:SUMF1/EgtB/PvdO family nonheme iron enzyme [Gemmataceae bacterium]